MNAENAKTKHLEAQQLFQQQKFAEALALLDELDQAFPNEQNIMYARARCLLALGRLDEARQIGAYLKDVLGHRRGTELLAQIDASVAAAMPTVEMPHSTPKSAPQARSRQAGSKKVVAIGVAFASLVIVAATFFLYNGYIKLSKMAEASPLIADTASLPLPDKPTFSKDVAPILNKNCIVCHRPGEPVPMALTSYELARPWAKSIREKVNARQMPPWHADPTVGTWANDRRLSDRDLTTIVRWVDQGTPEGDPKDAPVLPTFTKGWKIGEPDMVFTMMMPQVLPADLEDEYRYVYIPTGFTKDRWISASEIRPGNINVVHHIIVFTADTASGKEGLGGSLGGFAPGAPPLIMEKGRGMKIKAGAVLVLQIHYHKEAGKIESDRSSIGIKFAKETVKKELRFGTIGTEKFLIPAGMADYQVDAKLVLDENIHLEQLIPHMHLRGKDMKVWANPPGGSKEDLISVPNYDFNWQTFYKLAKPIALPKGTELNALAHFDNSAGNPFNPDPHVAVRWGEPTTAEMMYSFFMYTVDNENLSVKDPGDA